MNLPNPYVLPILFVGTLEVIVFIMVKFLWPTEDNTVLIGACTLALGQVATFLINSAQSATASKQAEVATQRAETANDRADAAREQVQHVSKQVEDVNAKASESQITSRTGLSALVKSEDLVRFDELADGFSKTTLTYGQTQEFIRLLESRLQDDLTIQQLTAAHRILEIMQRELNTPQIHNKPLVQQSPEDHAVSKQIQRQAEQEQRAAGTRKSDIEETNDKSAQAGESSHILALPSVVAAAQAAADSAEKTKAATQETVIVVAHEIEKEREENESKGKE